MTKETTGAIVLSVLGLLVSVASVLSLSVSFRLGDAVGVYCSVAMVGAAIVSFIGAWASAKGLLS